MAEPMQDEPVVGPAENPEQDTTVKYESVLGRMSLEFGESWIAESTEETAKEDVRKDLFLFCTHATLDHVDTPFRMNFVCAGILLYLNCLITSVTSEPLGPPSRLTAPRCSY